MISTNRAVRILMDKPGDIVIQGQGPGQVVVSEAYYPGWKVLVDGKYGALEIFETEFLAASLPEGPHYIQFKYSPICFRWGAVISLLTAILTAAWCYKSVRKNSLNLTLRNV